MYTLHMYKMQAFHITKCVGMQKSKKTLGGLNEKVFGIWLIVNGTQSGMT